MLVSNPDVISPNSPKYDLVSHRYLSRHENQLHFIRRLANCVHQWEVRDNGLPYISHLDQVERLTLKYVNEGYRTKARKISYSHDIPEDSVSSDPTKSSLRAFYDLLNEMGEYDRRRLINPVGLLTKLSDARMKRNFDLTNFSSTEMQYFIKTRRIVDTTKGFTGSNVLGDSVLLEDRIFAALVYIPDLNSNSDPNETLDENVVRSKYYLSEREVSFDEYLSQKESAFMERSNRNLLRNLILMPTLFEFLYREECTETGIYDVEKLRDVVDEILEISNNQLIKRKVSIPQELWSEFNYVMQIPDIRV